MLKFGVEVRGLRQLQRNFARSRKIVEVEMRRGLEMIVRKIQAEAARYPPPPPASTYRRTGTLGRSIVGEVKGLGREMRGIVGSSIPYAQYVISEKKQAWMHRGRWQTLEALKRKYADEIRAVFALAGTRIAAALVGGAGRAWFRRRWEGAKGKLPKAPRVR